MCLHFLNFDSKRFIKREIFTQKLTKKKLCSGKNAKLPGYMDYLHLSTADVAILKGSWAVLEEHVTRVGVDFFLDLINNHEEIRSGIVEVYSLLDLQSIWSSPKTLFMQLVA